MATDDRVDLLLHEGTDVIEHRLLLFTHIIIATAYQLKIRSASLPHQLSLSLEQLLLHSLQLLLTGLHGLVFLEDALSGLEVVGLDLFHFAGDALDHFRFPLSQLLHLRAVICLQLLLEFSQFELAAFLLLHADVGYFEISNPRHFLFEFFPASLLQLTLVLDEPYL